VPAAGRRQGTRAVEGGRRLGAGACSVGRSVLSWAYSPSCGTGVPGAETARRLGHHIPRVRERLAIERHLAEARHQAAMAARLCARLAALAAGLAQQDSPSPEPVFSTVEEMITMDGTIHGTTGLLMYDDVDAAHDYIVRVFGLASGGVWKSADGVTEFGEVRAGDQVIGLHPAGGKGFGSPRSVDAVTGVTVISVEDTDAHYARSVAAGARIVCEPVDQSYGIREYGAADPEDQIWFFQSPLG